MVETYLGQRDSCSLTLSCVIVVAYESTLLIDIDIGHNSIGVSYHKNAIVVGIMDES